MNNARNRPAERSGKRSGKRFVRRFLAVFVAMTTAWLGLGIAWINGWNIPGATGATYIKVTRLHAAYSGVATNQAIFIMFVGSDLRPGVGGARGDALHLVGINPALHAATIVDIPRDTCVNFGGHSRKINEGNSHGGVANQAAIVSSMVGVPIRYGVEVAFESFTSLVNGVGGLSIDVPMPMHDHYSGAVFQPGAQHMNGDQALAFSRNRHDFPRSDIQRTWNQGYLMVAAIRQLSHQFTSISGRFRLVDLLMRHSELSGLGVQDLIQLGQLAESVPAHAIKNVTVPTSGGSCLSLAPAASALFADFRDNGVLDRYPAGNVKLPDPRP